MSGALSRISIVIRFLGAGAVFAATISIFDADHERTDAAPPSASADRKGKDDRVEELMERVHEGKRSPLARTKAILSAAAVDWTELTQHATVFATMSDALVRSSDAAVRDSADGYADAVRALSEAVKQHNPQNARTALKALTNSCGDCHYKGGPGGKLDDD